MATRAAKHPGITAGHYTVRLRRGLFRFATAHCGYQVGSNHPLAFGTSTPRSIWWSCSSMRICRIKIRRAHRAAELSRGSFLSSHFHCRDEAQHIFGFFRSSNGLWRHHRHLARVVNLLGNHTAATPQRAPLGGSVGHDMVKCVVCCDESFDPLRPYKVRAVASRTLPRCIDART
jgi:hypothetical protein